MLCKGEYGEAEEEDITAGGVFNLLSYRQNYYR